MRAALGSDRPSLDRDAQMAAGPDHHGNPAAQSSYPVASIPALAAAGTEQVFVTLRDGVRPRYESEGILAGDGGPGRAVSRRRAFATVRRAAAGN